MLVLVLGPACAIIAAWKSQLLFAKIGGSVSFLLVWRAAR
jgi:hypothetical protein